MMALNVRLGQTGNNIHVKLVNNLHSITLYKLHNKLSCVSS